MATELDNCSSNCMISKRPSWPLCVWKCMEVLVLVGVACVLVCYVLTRDTDNLRPAWSRMILCTTTPNTVSSRPHERTSVTIITHLARVVTEYLYFCLGLCSR